jgi:ABC-type uncharacterized transport system substrate-binding protein
MIRTLALSGFVAALPVLAVAHPHVFVDTEVDIVFDGDGALSGVRLTWVYDDFFSFLLTEELGLDPEGDMILTEEELATLTAFVLDWPEDFGGDLVVEQGGVPVALGRPREGVVELVEGRVRESHLRPVDLIVGADAPVLVQVFDPYYYSAYDIVLPPRVTGAEACDAALQKADLHAAYSLVDEVLYGRPASDVGPEEDFPEVGYAFADTITVTCDASS